MFAGAVLSILLALPNFAAFEISGHILDTQVVNVGDPLKLKCKTDTKWEYCTWRHLSNTGKLRECHIEWKWTKGGTSIQKCHEELTGRVSITGNYQINECGLRILDTVSEDTGTWECEVEDYVLFGSKGSGSRVKHQFSVSIREDDQEVKQARPTSEKTTTTATLEATTILAEDSKINDENFNDKTKQEENFIKDLVEDVINEVVEQHDINETNTVDPLNDNTNTTDNLDEENDITETSTVDHFDGNTNTNTSEYMDEENVLPLEESENNAEYGLGVGTVVGIMVVCLTAVAAVVALTLFVLKEKTRKQQKNLESL